MVVRIRDVRQDDLPFMWCCLAMAAHTDPMAAWSNPGIARRLRGWGRPGDFGVVAEAGESPVGAAWARQLARDEAHYVWVDETTPEVVLAVAPGWRGGGVGRALMEALVAAARGQGCGGLCLTVRVENVAARALYESLGFVLLPGGPVVNRVGGMSVRMHLPLFPSLHAAAECANDHPSSGSRREA